MFARSSLFLLAFSLNCGTFATDEPAIDPKVAAQLTEVEKALGEKPDDLMLYIQRMKLLAQAGKHDEAFAAGQTAMGKFVAADKELAWLGLETIEVEGHRVMVLFNMGPNERRPPADGITRPLTFRVFGKDGAGIVEAFDFEIGYFGGKAVTAAFGKTTAEGHANLGPVNPDTPYSKLRPAAIELIKRLVK